MSVHFTPRASYKPLGRQPFRPGQWQGARIGGNHTTYIQNNFFGSYSTGMSGFNYGNYNCNHDDGGMSKGMKWLLGLGAGATLLGGILKLFGVGGKEPATVEHEPVSTQPPVEPENTNIPTPEESSPGKVDDGPEGPTTPTTVGNEKQDVLKVDKKTIKTTTTYPVQHGETWANIITGKYKDENGNPISFSDAKELWTQLKEECGVSKDADGMPANIELPNEFKQYKLDIDGTVKKIGEDEYKTEGYKAFDGHVVEAKKTTSYTATGTINGQSIGTISGSGKEVTEQLLEQGFTKEQIKDAMTKGEITIVKQKPEEAQYLVNCKVFYKSNVTKCKASQSKKSNYLLCIYFIYIREYKTED